MAVYLESFFDWIANWMFHIIQRSTIRRFVKMIILTGECVLELAGSLFLTHLALSLSLTFHKNSKGGRDDCCSVFVKSVARSQSRPRLRPCTRQLRLVLSHSLSPVPLKPADLYTPTGFKWSRRLTSTKSEMTSERKLLKFASSTGNRPAINIAYLHLILCWTIHNIFWDCSRWKQLIVATGQAGRFEIWNLDCHKELENHQNKFLSHEFEFTNSQHTIQTLDWKTLCHKAGNR